MLKPGADVDRPPRRAPRLRGLVRPRAHRLRRLPDLLPRARRQRAARRRRRDLPLHLRRRHAPPHPGVRGGDPDRARRRHPDGARRVRAAAVADRRAARRPSTAPRPGRSGRGRRSSPRSGPSSASSASCRAAPTCALRIESAERTARGRVRRLRDRRPVGGGVAGRDARHAGRHAAAPARRPAAVPDGAGRPDRDRRVRGPGHRPVRLRAAHPVRPPRHDPVQPRVATTSKRAENATADGPLDDACGCPVCARWSRAYLRHLLVVDEPTAPRLLTLHNVWWTLHLVAEVRAAVEAGSLEGVRSRIAAAYG